MISAVDLLASFGRLTSLAPAPSDPNFAKAEAPAEVEGSPSSEEPTSPLPVLTLVKPVASAGDSLAGLLPPQSLDPNQAAFGLISTDEVRVVFDSSGASVQSAPGVTRSLASGHASARSSTTKVQPMPSQARAAQAKSRVQNISPSDAKELTASLANRLRSTPTVLTSLMASVRPDAAPQQPERAGVIASFILNAAMIPGWPLPAVLQPGATSEAQAAYAAFQEMDEAELLDLVAALGGDEVLRARLTTACDDGDRRRKLLRAATVLATVIGAFVTALRAEVEELLSDFVLIASGEAPEAWSGRIRLPLK